MTAYSLKQFELLMQRSLEELSIKTALHEKTLSLSHANWALDLDLGTISFTGVNRIKVVFSVQVIGTFNTLDGTWLWGWDHPSVATPLRKHAMVVRECGAKYANEKLMTRKILSDEREAWEFTALACKLNEALGAYRGPAGSALIFVTFERMLSGV